MKREKEIAEHSEVSEKAIEAYLVKRAKEEGGKALKYSNPSETGYPDRILILPNCLPIFLEIKSKGKKPRPIQELRINELCHLGQVAMYVDSKSEIDAVIGVTKKYYRLNAIISEELCM